MALSEKAYKILVPRGSASIGQSSNQKGEELESLVHDFLKYQDYEIVRRFRESGTEIDLLCRHNITGATIVVECKAQDRSIQSDSINKLFADVSLQDASHGWIITTGDLGKEAQAQIRHLNNKKGVNLLRHFAPNDLVTSLIRTGAVTFPSVNLANLTGEFLLILWRGQRYWATACLGKAGAVVSGYYCWNAASGQPIEPDIAPEFNDMQLPFPEVGWLPHLTSRQSNIQKQVENQPVVEVIAGDGWSDYRPSRPIDFVGRSALIQEVDSFFDSVRLKNTPTRIIGIKRKSGWGKSSLALKLSDTFSLLKTLVLAVDCRAASSASYADLALGRALSRAAKEMAYGPLFAPKIDFRSNPFEEPSVSAFLGLLDASKVVICIIFDQFEAVIHRVELTSTFERMREIALFADELRGPVVVGFSWKTDGTTNTDNPGYHTWHALSDRRRDFEVDKFTREDADQFMALALKSAHVQLPRPVHQFIIRQYAGFPWLLKKLIRHFVDEIRNNGPDAKFVDVYNMSSLFDSDLQELSTKEKSTLEFVAKNAPIEGHIAEEKCDSTSVYRLIDKRLIIKSGSQLSLYWDIFRDYILTKQIPQIPSTYIPSISVRKIRSVIRILNQNTQLSYEEFGHFLGVSAGTADNCVRDLDNMGLVKPSRIFGYFETNTRSPMDATSFINKFLTGHVVFVRAKELIDLNGSTSIEEIEHRVRQDYSFLSLDKRTLKTYVRKIIIYSIDFGVLRKSGNEILLSKGVINILDSSRRVPTFQHDELFRAAASPHKVVELIERVKSGECTTLDYARQIGLRNAVYASSTLGLLEYRDGKICTTEVANRSDDTISLVREAASRVEPIVSLLGKNDIIYRSSNEVGEYISDIFELNWSPSSCKRNGGAIAEWCRWVSPVD